MTIWKKRLFALLLGTFLTVLGLELLLAGFQWGFVKYQRHRNVERVSEDSKPEIRILTIGESTTGVAGDETGTVLIPQTSYPAQLERILNERQDVRTYRVFNNGMMGGATPAIIDMMHENVRDFEPHIVIAMMGIKDKPFHATFTETSVPKWAERFRTMQLISWLMESRQLQQNASPERFTSSDELPSTLRIHQHRLRKFVKETRLLKGRVDPLVADDLELATFYWFTGRHTIAEEVLTDTIEEHDIGYNLLAHVLVTNNRGPQAQRLLEDVVARHPEEGMYREMLVEVLRNQGDFEAAEAVLLQAYQDAPQFNFSGLVVSYLQLMEGALAHQKGEHERAVKVLQSIQIDKRALQAPRFNKLSLWFPPLQTLIPSQLGEVYLTMGEWDLAREQLEIAVDNNPNFGANVWMLAQAYRKLGMKEKEQNLRLLVTGRTERLAEYFETAKMYRLYGMSDQIHSLFVEAESRIPSLSRSYEQLYRAAEQNGFQVVVMQYPSFGLDLLHIYAPEREGVLFIDNEHVFDAAPDEYFFEPRFPYSFSHYTMEGAHVLAEHVADNILALEDLGVPEE